MFIILMVLPIIFLSELVIIFTKNSRFNWVLLFTLKLHVVLYFIIKVVFVTNFTNFTKSTKFTNSTIFIMIVIIIIMTIIMVIIISKFMIMPMVI